MLWTFSNVNGSESAPLLQPTGQTLNSTDSAIITRTSTSSDGSPAQRTNPSGQESSINAIDVLEIVFRRLDEIHTADTPEEQITTTKRALASENEARISELNTLQNSFQDKFVQKEQFKRLYRQVNSYLDGILDHTPQSFIRINNHLIIPFCVYLCLAITLDTLVYAWEIPQNKSGLLTTLPPMAGATTLSTITAIITFILAKKKAPTDMNTIHNTWKSKLTTQKVEFLKTVLTLFLAKSSAIDNTSGTINEVLTTAFKNADTFIELFHNICRKTNPIALR